MACNDTIRSVLLGAGLLLACLHTPKALGEFGTTDSNNLRNLANSFLSNGINRNDLGMTRMASQAIEHYITNYLPTLGYNNYSSHFAYGDFSQGTTEGELDTSSMVNALNSIAYALGSYSPVANTPLPAAYYSNSSFPSLLQVLVGLGDNQYISTNSIVGMLRTQEDVQSSIARGVTNISTQVSGIGRTTEEILAAMQDSSYLQSNILYTLYTSLSPDLLSDPFSSFSSSLKELQKGTSLTFALNPMWWLDMDDNYWSFDTGYDARMLVSAVGDLYPPLPEFQYSIGNLLRYQYGNQTYKQTFPNGPGPQDYDRANITAITNAYAGPMAETNDIPFSDHLDPAYSSLEADYTDVEQDLSSINTSKDSFFGKLEQDIIDTFVAPTESERRLGYSFQVEFSNGDAGTVLVDIQEVDLLRPEGQDYTAFEEQCQSIVKTALVLIKVLCWFYMIFAIMGTVANIYGEDA